MEYKNFALNSDKPKIVNVTITLEDVNWIKSTQGLFYCEIETAIQNIISVSINEFNLLRDTDNIHIGFKDNKIFLTSNTNTFVESKSNIILNVVYL